MNPILMIWTVFLDTAPFLLLGLFLAGWLKVLLPTGKATSLLSRPGLKSALYAALVGLPLPICSCGVVPVALGLRAKGVSREANLSFIISTPETSVGTFAISWGLLGPITTVFRLFSALFVALFAAVLSIAHRTDRKEPSHSGATLSCSDVPNKEKQREYAIVGFSVFIKTIKSALVRILEKPAKEDQLDEGVDSQSREETTDTVVAGGTEPTTEEQTSLGQVVSDAFHYGFVHVFADISLWLVIGIILAGLIAAFVPEGTFDNIPGGNLSTMLLVLLISVPMYVCAVESTPIAAMLIMKGLSPGAALLFLLAGPATNITGMLLIRSSFGSTFFRIYLAAVLTGAFVAGLFLDGLLAITGWTVSLQETIAFDNPLWVFVSYLSAVVLLGLIFHSFIRMNWREKWRILSDLFLKFRSILKVAREIKASLKHRPRVRRLVIVVAALVALSGYFATGIYTVSPGNTGFHIRLGRIVEVDVAPGLHYHLPWPFARVVHYRTEEARKADLGYQMDTKILKSLRENPNELFGDSWHSFFTNMNDNPEQASYLLGDENQLEAKFSIHFRVKDNLSFHYKHAKNANLVTLVVESVLRKYMAAEIIDDVLTTHRSKIEDAILAESQDILDGYEMGVEILDIHAVDLHPPLAAVQAFREVASAMEDRETFIHNAHAARESDIPRARGEAEKRLGKAAAIAQETVSVSTGKSESFKVRAAANSDFKQATTLRMSVETKERALTGLRKIVVPSECKGRIRLWSPGRPYDNIGDLPIEDNK